jgi:hypothetical protein
MATFGRRSVLFVENLAGPFDWSLDDRGGYEAFEGRFLIYDRSGSVRDYVRGRIAFRDRQTAEVYLFDPPVYIAEHRHGRCIQLLEPASKWFKLHFEKPPTTFRDAYTFVEHMLTEAFNLTH